jgi:ferritin
MALLEQWTHESLNANIYLYVGGFLKNKGLDHLASFFIGQYSEELEHAKIIFDLLTDLSASITLLEIDKVDFPINSIMDIAQKFLEREIITTESLDEIKKLAIDTNNPVVEERMREMIKAQQKEYEEATGFMDHAELTGNNWFNVLLWDLGEK